jgi:hypothetical protein
MQVPPGSRPGKESEDQAARDLPASEVTLEGSTGQLPEESVEEANPQLVLANESSYLAAPENEAPSGADTVIARKSRVILALANATPESLDGLLKEHCNELDQELLETLHARIQTAQRFDEVRSFACTGVRCHLRFSGARCCIEANVLRGMQGSDVVEGLTLLFHRIRSEVERRSATPSLRLLDDLMLIMESHSHGAAGNEAEATALEDVEERMQRAFALERGSVDIFAVAQALAGGDAGAAPLPVMSEDEVEFVPHADFVAEVERLVAGAQERVDMAEMRLARKAVGYCCRSPVTACVGPACPCVCPPPSYNRRPGVDRVSDRCTAVLCRQRCSKAWTSRHTRRLSIASSPGM